MQYRREIDGLRAVAVVPVILHHAAPGLLGGGFVGVDVFFVISGYLITAILAADIAGGRFSLARFYERRARRILPALFVVVLACLPFAWALMWPMQLREFGQSIVAVVLFVSNLFFWRKSGYFADVTQIKPLIHTWSLGVEEQFYLLFPLLLLALWKLGPRRAMLAIAGLALLSLLGSEWASTRAPTANFYLAPTRAWELLAGSLCALALNGRPQPASQALSLLGLVLLVAAFLLLDEQVRFPGFSALLPVMGTVLIIFHATPQTMAGRLLGTRPFVGIGLVSYSAYLWHQPIFAFARLAVGHEPPWPVMAALAGLTMLLAWASWRFVEQPFRRSGHGLLPTRRRLFLGAGAASLAMLATGVALHAARGFPDRFPQDIQRIMLAEQDRPKRVCFTEVGETLPQHPTPACRHPGADGQVHVMLMGDSHSLALARGVSEQLRAAGIGHYETGMSACMPLPGFERQTRDFRLECARYVEATLQHARASGIDTLVLAARWPVYVEGRRFDNGEGGVEGDEQPFVDVIGKAGAADSPDRKRRVLAEMRRQITALAADFTVVLVSPIPEAGWKVPQRAVELARQAGRPVPVTTDLARYRERTRAVDQLFRQLAAEVPGVRLARAERAFCDADRCLNADSAGVYYYDDDHLTSAGARRVAPLIVAAVAETPGDQPGQRPSTQ
ncbi:acyltransferase family protein [Sandarakinorhabdus rubra]|uniref:acyltransferase family protein n=1 Tax=Sandarakinorhabdus rubra TaxID=2672568 RepID=UPI0022A7978E|nr:acyltransferase family protein [Sandarakinorhabdus rubra]